MERKDFEILVGEAMDTIPEESAEKIKNVVILVEDVPSQKTLRRNNVSRGWTLFGLYEGIPLTERGDYYGIGGTLPDRITIFQKPIEESADSDPEKIKKIVHDTVLHEIAHHFGMGERRVREWERKKRVKDCP